MANPAPWATTAFGTTAFTLSLYQTGLLNSAGVLIVLPVSFFLGGLVLIISAVLQFCRGDMFDGAVSGTFGPFWLIYGTFQTFYAARVPAAQFGSATSLLLAVFAVVTFYLAIASLRTDLVNAMVLWLALAGLVLLSIGAAASIGSVTKAGGAAALAFAILACYLAVATSSSPPSTVSSCRSARRHCASQATALDRSTADGPGAPAAPPSWTTCGPTCCRRRSWLISMRSCSRRAGDSADLAFGAPARISNGAAAHPHRTLRASA